MERTEHHEEMPELASTGDVVTMTARRRRVQVVTSDHASLVSDEVPVRRRRSSSRPCCWNQYNACWTSACSIAGGPRRHALILL